MGTLSRRDGQKPQQAAVHKTEIRDFPDRNDILCSNPSSIMDMSPAIGCQYLTCSVRLRMQFAGYPWVLMGILDDHSTNQQPVKYSSSFAGVQAQIASRYLPGGSNEVFINSAERSSGQSSHLTPDILKQLVYKLSHYGKEYSSNQWR